MKLSAVILAGGQSRRMGRDKAWIEYQGRPLVRLALDRVRAAGIEEVFISGRPGVDYSSLGCPVLLDLEPGQGPLGGIERGLRHCTSPLLLVLAVDLPRMTTRLLREMVARCDDFTGVVPVRNDELEPLAAIYPKRCLAIARDQLVRGRLAAREFGGTCLREEAVMRWIVPPENATRFANWNRPEDRVESQPGNKRVQISS